MVSREQIEEHVRVVVAEEDLPLWWGLYLPRFQCTAEVAFRQAPEELLSHVMGYADPSYS